MSVLISSSLENLSESMRQILNTYLKDADFRRGVFIKPNIVFPARPESGEITSPTLVRSLVGELRELHEYVDIIIGEGVAAGCDPAENFRFSGYTELAEELNVPLLDLNQAERKSRAWKFGKLDLPCAALERIYINLPILKPSSACIISGALKNQKGLLLPETKKQFHRHGLHEQITELNQAIHPDLTILDGSLFFGGKVLLAGDNCGEIDATICQLLNIDEPEHVRYSRSAGVFKDGFTIVGENINLRTIRPGPTEEKWKQLARLRLWSNPRACTMCRYIFRDIKHNFFKHPNMVAGLKLLNLSIKGAELLMGKDPIWRKEYATVICVGECTRRLAKADGFIHISGCPPSTADFLDGLP